MSSRIFTRRILGLDQRVWLTMLILTILSVALLSYKLMDRKKCTAFSIRAVTRAHFTDTTYYTGNNIFFEASSFNDDITWTFGDKSGDIKEGLVATHKFTDRGKYYVSASINGQCETGLWVTVENKPADNEVKENTPDIKEIVGPSTTLQGNEEVFFSPALADSFYEWVILFHPEMGKQTGESAKFHFANAGRYTIQLTLDRIRIKSYTKDIFVEELPKVKVLKPKEGNDAVIEKLIIAKKKEEPKTVVPLPAPEPTVVPAEPKIIRIGDKLFRSELQQLVEEKKSEEDFYKYLCGKGSTPVNINSKSDKSRTFSQLCKEIRGKKGKSWIVLKGGSITIKSVKLIRDDNNKDCISLIEVEY